MNVRKFYTATLTLVTGTAGYYIIPDTQDYRGVTVIIRGATAGLFHLIGSGVGGSDLTKYADLYDPTYTNALKITAPDRNVITYNGPGKIIIGVDWNRPGEPNTGSVTAYMDVWLYDSLNVAGSGSLPRGI